MKQAVKGKSRADVDRVRDAGVSPIIYSSLSQWPAVMGASRDFPDLALWDAERPGDLAYPLGFNPLAAAIRNGEIIRGSLA